MPQPREKRYQKRTINPFEVNTVLEQVPDEVTLAAYFVNIKKTDISGILRDTPSTPISQSPQSSSCSPFTTGYYNGAGISGSAPPISSSQGQVFFPQTPTGLGPPTTPLGVGGGNYRGRVFFGQPTPSPSGSSSYSSQHSGNSPADSNPSCSSAAPIYHHFPTTFSSPASGTNSSSSNSNNITTTSPSMTTTIGAVAGTSGGTVVTWSSGDDGNESSSSSSSSSDSSSAGGATGGCSPLCLGHQVMHNHHMQHLQHPQQHLDSIGGSLMGAAGGGVGTVGVGSSGSGFIPPHLDYMAGREQLQEFTGKIPQRKKKSKPNKSKKTRFLEQTLVWPTLAVTATLIALGCGLLAAR
ncbi:putative lysozyme-like protein [Uranotaenia lowii]|uniref:putative lysozyme-like protein n=1 Tax=Uranotaenia lowii TaxID=190385 RepID=UPI0024799DB7|nr:putative lysozyme-like protein [Uranotaenia lowii]